MSLLAACICMRLQVHLSSLFFCIAVDKPLKQGKRKEKTKETFRNKRWGRWIVQHSKKVPVGEVEEVTGGRI